MQDLFVFEGLKCTRMKTMIELFFFSLAEMVKEENHICSRYKPMLFIPWEIYHFVLRKYIEMSLYIYAKCTKCPSSVWETWILFKLEKWLCLNFLYKTSIEFISFAKTPSVWRRPQSSNLDLSLFVLSLNFVQKKVNFVCVCGKEYCKCKTSRYCIKSVHFEVCALPVQL